MLHIYIYIYDISSLRVNRYRGKRDSFKWIELDQDRFGSRGVEFMGSIIGSCNLFVC